MMWQLTSKFQQFFHFLAKIGLNVGLFVNCIRAKLKFFILAGPFTDSTIVTKLKMIFFFPWKLLDSIGRRWHIIHATYTWKQAKLSINRQKIKRNKNSTKSSKTHPIKKQASSTLLCFSHRHKCLFSFYRVLPWWISLGKNTEEPSPRMFMSAGMENGTKVVIATRVENQKLTTQSWNLNH